MAVILDKLPGFVRFARRCSQGVVGKCVYDEIPVVWKISKKADFTCESEYNTGKIIKDSHLKILPHFVEIFDCKNVYLSSLDTTKRKCVFMEEIKGGDLLTVIQNCGESPDVMSLLLQTLISIAAAQDLIDFTHYDLHVENVLVKKTNDDIHVYIFPDGKVYTLETNGLCSVIIDYGFAHTSEFTNLLPSIFHNEAGFQPQHFSPLSDVMTLLCSTIFEFNNPDSRLLSECKKMFKGVGQSLNWEYGWFEGFMNIPKAMRRVLKPPIPEVRSDSIFRDIPLIVDIVQALIPLPITEDNEDVISPHDSFTKSYSELYYHWFLVEEDLSNIELEGLLLKTIVEAIKDGKEYEIEKIVKDVMGRTFEIDYQVIQNSLRVFASRIKSELKRIIKKDTVRRDRVYAKLPISSALDVYKRLKTQTYYGKDDKVKVFDLRDGTTFSFNINKIQAKKLNKRTLTIESLIFN